MNALRLSAMTVVVMLFGTVWICSIIAGVPHPACTVVLAVPTWACQQ